MITIEQRGEKFQGRTCNRNPEHGHTRFMSNGVCVQCVRELGERRRKVTQEKAAERKAST